MFIIIVFIIIWYFDLVGLGRPGFFLYFFPHSRFSSSRLHLVFLLFHYCCSHARVFGKTLVHEIPFSDSDSHTEWYNIFPRNDMNGRRVACHKLYNNNSIVYCYGGWVIIFAVMFCYVCPKSIIIIVLLYMFLTAGFTLCNAYQFNV